MIILPGEVEEKRVEFKKQKEKEMNKTIDHECKLLDMELIKKFKSGQVLFINGYFCCDSHVDIIKQRYIDKGWYVKMEWGMDHPYEMAYPIFVFSDVSIKKKWSWKKLKKEWAIK
jgi:hypothetical protein